jgi:hypothetical protein
VRDAGRRQGDRQQQPCHPDGKKLVNADTDNDGEYSQAELEAMNKAQIKELAEECGYSIGDGTKAQLITAFLAAQTAAADDDDESAGG